MESLLHVKCGEQTMTRESTSEGYTKGYGHYCKFNTHSCITLKH